MQQHKIEDTDLTMTAESRKGKQTDRQTKEEQEIEGSA